LFVGWVFARKILLACKYLCVLKMVCVVVIIVGEETSIILVVP